MSAKKADPWIVQIMPAPPGVRAAYAMDDGKVDFLPVMGLALIEEESGGRVFRCVRALVNSPERDGIATAEEDGNFLGLDAGEGNDWEQDARRYRARLKEKNKTT